MNEVQRVTRAIAAENEKQDMEDAAFAKEIKAFERVSHKVCGHAVECSCNV